MQDCCAMCALDLLDLYRILLSGKPFHLKGGNDAKPFVGFG